jgi:pyruvate/2-oxoglutarate dehydrogenase complex dihydrolipoamide acyltransferase (E2) component
MYNVQPYSKNRQVIHDLLHRATKFHMPISTTWEIDCTEAMDQLRDLRRKNVPAGFTAFLVKATAKLLEDNPQLNSHLFTKWTGKKTIVQFDDINCNVVVQRENNGEKILLPLVVNKANKLSISEIDNIIHKYKTSDLASLPQFESFEKIKKMPFWLLTFISYKTRSDPDFYLKYYGTYGLSALYSFKASGAVGGSTVANTCIAFLPFNFATSVDNGKKRRTMRLSIVMDHYILDGVQMSRAGHEFQKLIENPKKVRELIQS